MSGNPIENSGLANGSDDSPARRSEEAGDVVGRRPRLSGELSDFLLHYRQSPLPPPEEFAAYENVVPGAGDRILSMAENRQELVGRDRELQHTEFMRVVETNAETERWGQRIAGAFIVTMTIVWGVIMVSDVEGGLKIASTVFPAIIAGANAYRAVRRMWKNDTGPSDRHLGDEPLELERRPSRGHTERE